jgi:intracellular septation protein A
MNATLKFALDMLPLAAFFIGYQLGDLFLATALIMAATIISIVISYALEKKIALNPLLTGGMVMVFGGLTLYLNDELFIKMKPTIVNLLFAAVYDARCGVENIVAKMGHFLCVFGDFKRSDLAQFFNGFLGEF